MGNRKDSPELQLVKGVDKKNPSRVNKKSPIGLPVGNPPTRMSNDEKKMWREIKKEVVEGVLQKSDRKLLEITSRLMCEYLQNPLIFSSAKMTRMESIFSKFGMSPSDRRNIIVDKKDKDNDFSFLDD